MLKFRHVVRCILTLALFVGLILIIRPASAHEYFSVGGTDAIIDTPTPCSTPGSLDETFDGDGKFITRMGGSVSAIALQSDGKIVAVGTIYFESDTRFLILRYNPDGSLDETFAVAGVVTTSFGSNYSSANGVAIQADGKLVVVGSARIGSAFDFAVARYNSDGSLDSSFDDDGLVTTAIPGLNGNHTDVANAVGFQSDGKMVVAGNVPDGSGTSVVFGVVRYNTDGSVDTSFGFAGVTYAGFYGPDYAQSLVIQPDDKVVVAGRGFSYLVIARLNPDGSFDNSFDLDGKLLTSFGLGASSFAIALQSDGKIVASGRQNGFFAATRYNIYGSIDTSFGTDGIIMTPIDGNSGIATSIAVQPDGKVVAAGYDFVESSNYFTVVRYNSDGTPDTSFGGDGIISDTFTNYGIARATLIQPDGKIVVAGSITGGTGGGIAFARYHGAPCGPPTASPTETPTSTPTETPTASPTLTGTATNTSTPTSTATPNFSCSFDNGGTGGGLNPQAISESGVPAPVGYFWSEVQHDAANFEETNSAGGFSGAKGFHRLADDFTISQPCRISTVDLYAYSPDAPETPSPFTSCMIRIWKGRPGDLGSTVVFGDMTTNRLVSSVDTSYYRIFNTVTPPTEPVTTLKIWKNTLSVGTTLHAGTYWLEWASVTIDLGRHFYPAKTVAGSRGEIRDNARQISDVSFSSWFDVRDSGYPNYDPVKQDFPFNISGETPSTTPTATRTATSTPTPTPLTPITECAVTQNFDDVAGLSATGWVAINHSSPSGTKQWFQGDEFQFPSQSGAPNSYAAVNFQSGSGHSTLSNWLVTPPVLLQNGGRLTFWTRTTAHPAFPDRLQIRMGINGTSDDVGTTSTDVGDFSTPLLDINPTYAISGYPIEWTQYTITISGLVSPVKGRLAFRYFLDDGGPDGNNSDYIGIDSVEYNCSPVEPSPTVSATDTPVETPTATPTPADSPINTATQTATPTSTPLYAINGVVTYGNSTGAPTTRFVSNVLLTGTGAPNVFAISDYPTGSYSLTGFGAGPYSVAPSKLGGESNSISSFDAAKIAAHVAGVTLLTGNQLLVADVSNSGTISSFDVSQIARYVASTPPYGLTGSWKFLPESRSYATIAGSMVNEDYSALLMGEVSGNWIDNGSRHAAGQQTVASGKHFATRGGFAKQMAVQLPNFITPVGKQVVVPVTVLGAAGTGVISYEFDLTYNPTVIQPLAEPVDLSGTTSRGLSAVANSTEPGLLRVVVYGAMPIEENGVLLELRFTAVGNPGSVSPLTWERIVFNEDDFSVEATDGQIELQRTMETKRP